MDLTYPRPSKIKNLLISAVCISGIAGSWYRLQHDVYTPGASFRGEPMAIVEQCDENARRKHSSSFVWSSVSPGATLYRKDSLKIGPGGTASIRMNDGSRLDLGENSLIIVDDLKQLALNFMRGSFIVRGAEGDREISVGRDGKTVTKELAVRLTAPKAGARVFVQQRQTAQIAFAWEFRVPISPFDGAPVLQISSDRSFPRNGTRDLPLPDSKTQALPAALPPGHYYWRLSNAQGPLTEARPLFVVVAEPLKPMYPDTGSKVSVWGKSSPVQFRWVAQASDVATSSHWLEISREPGFETLHASESVDAETGTATIRNLPDGQSFWRLRSAYGQVSVVSAPVPFSVTTTERLVVKLSEPSEGAAIEARPLLRFTWQFEDTSTEFRWELSQGNAAPRFFRTRARTLDWNAPTPGEYRWRVLAVRDEQIVGESPWRSFSIFPGAPLTLVAPADASAITFWNKPVKFRFEWKADDAASAAGGYRVRVGRDVDLTQGVQVVSTRGTELASDALKLTPGTWFWRVEVPNGKGAAKTSRVARFRYGPPEALRAPLIQGPDAGASFPVLEEGSDPVLTWEAVEDAKEYEVTLERSGAPPVRKLTRALRISTKGLPAGTYRWTVRAVDPNGKPGDASLARELTILYGKRLRAPESTEYEVE